MRIIAIIGIFEVSFNSTQQGVSNEKSIWNHIN
jgi:hypothetical protein